MTERRLNLAEVHDLAFNCLKANGCDGDNAQAVADTVTAAERDGSESHGLFRLPGYVASLKSGKVDGRAQPAFTDLAPGVLKVDARGGFAPLALDLARPRLLEKARTQGIAAAAFVNVHHFAALWPEVEALARSGLVGIACTCTLPFTAPAGGAKAVFGTNPLAFAWPRSLDDDDVNPVLFDMATTTQARGEVMIAKREGHGVPLGVGLDGDGNPTTDPAAILSGGVMLPFGGYKGSAISMMVELLAAALIGEGFSFEAGAADNYDGGPARGGELLIAIDPGRFGDPTGWQAHAEALFQKMIASGKDETAVRLPGDRRYANRARTPVDGTAIPEALYEKIVELTGDAGADTATEV
ncbi:MAG: Ldh family oxidoreductase [Rhodospirillaceae bacterium]